MTTWGKICRICSSPAEYEIFEKIPVYVHASCNEFLNWQQPINVLLEETTGLKVTENDGLPNKICALCISYLKHAVTFRQQCINNTLALKAVDLLRQRQTKDNPRKSLVDKESLLITAQELSYSEERQIASNLLNSKSQQEQDKVCKQLLNNSFQAPTSTRQNDDDQLRYLNLLFGKDINAGVRPKRRNDVDMGHAAVGSVSDPYAEAGSPSGTSSDENDGDEIEGNDKRGDWDRGDVMETIRTLLDRYEQKEFEEDDVMNMNELRDAINMPESCMERKCRACSRRFMFEESYVEHMDSCIELKFLTFFEDIQRLVTIRHSKEISPHEFIRRMIFFLRKMCEWLKKANCGDMLLPDLVQSNNSKQRLESEGKSSAASSSEQKTHLPAANTDDKLRQRFDNYKVKADKTTDFIKPNDKILLTTTSATNYDFNLDSNLGDLFKTPKPVASGTTTPISISNNILYEIERSQSRNSNSNRQHNVDTGKSTPLKKPIAVLASTTTTTTSTAIFNGASIGDNAERLTFLQKLQQATSQTPSASKVNANQTPKTPQISVRKDLLQTEPNNRDTPLSIPVPITPVQTANLTFSARCQPCNLLFETLAALEMHNALHHNNIPQPTQPVTQAPPHTLTPCTGNGLDEERRRIIALFEDDDAERI